LGKEAEFYQVITDIEKAKDVYVELARSIRKEALLLFVNAFAMIRADKIGVIDSLIEASTKKNAKIRIICPLTEMNSEILNRISQKSPNIQILNSIGSPSGLFIVDKAKFMRFEIKEPGADNFSEALGFIVYSNSKVAVDSCILFFDLFWNERIHYERLIELEKIKEADKMYKEFINIAAHELRTPGLADVLSLHIKDPQQQGNLSVIIRNAKRLQRLANGILDVTRIESQALELKIEQFDLNAVVSDCIQDAMNIVQMTGKDVKLLCRPGESAILVQADKARIGQVISNLLNNSIKFTEEGTICINLEAQDKQVNVSICDTGTGISSDIFPRLFTKFATNSFEGTGLGLFISRNY
jgi:two-component system, OmpR family, sensor histidine kinase VicK